MSLRLKAKVLLQYTKLSMIKVDIVYHSFVSIHISTHIHVYHALMNMYTCVCAMLMFVKLATKNRRSVGH